MMVWNMTGQVCHKHWSCYAWEHLNQVWSASVVSKLEPTFPTSFKESENQSESDTIRGDSCFQCMCHILKLFNTLERSDSETSNASVLSKTPQEQAILPLSTSLYQYQPSSSPSTQPQTPQLEKLHSTNHPSAASATDDKPHYE